MPDTIVPPALAAAAKLDPACYTVADLARLLQCSERHVWRQIDLGRVPGVLRVGRLGRISRAVADAWIAGQQGGDQ
jgi:excisionase family DNA binding protein